jgi:rhodanese-related sulfurtransferase
LTQSCSEAGVLGVIPGLLGCFQANEVLKLILRAGEPLSGLLLTIDCLDNTFRLLNINKKTRAPLINTTLGATATSTWCDIDWLSPDTLHKWIATKEPFQLVDVRDISEHQHDSLGGKLIPLKDIIKRQEELDTTHRIVFYCKSGVRSRAALLTFRNLNHEAELYSLEGGIQRYRAIYPDEHYPFVS